MDQDKNTGANHKRSTRANSRLNQSLETPIPNPHQRPIFVTPAPAPAVLPPPVIPALDRLRRELSFADCRGAVGGVQSPLTVIPDVPPRNDSAWSLDLGDAGAKLAWDYMDPSLRPLEQHRSRLSGLQFQAQTSREAIPTMQVPSGLENRTNFRPFSAAGPSVARPNNYARVAEPHPRAQPPPAGNRHRSSSPLSRWRITFDGTEATMSVEDLIFRLDYLKTSDGVTDEYLAQNIYRIFLGKAEQWYWQFCRTHDRLDWQSIRHALVSQFRGLATDYEIIRDIMDRKQGPRETFDDFSGAIISMNNRLRVPLPAIELIDIMRRNLLPKLSNITFTAICNTLQEFRYVCIRAERHLASIHPPRYEARHINEVQQVPAEYPQEYLEAYDKPKSKAILPPKAQTNWKCWNCELLGHGFKDCMAPPQGLFCYRCGERGIIAPHCHRCKQGNERRSVRLAGDNRHLPILPVPKEN